jgi:polysaccharide biosynthesis protein PslH
VRIIFITSRFPYPLEKGDKLRAYHQIRHLSREHEIHLFALSHKEVEAAHRFELMKYCRTVTIHKLGQPSSAIGAVLALFQCMPMQTGWFYRRWIQQKLAKLIDEIQAEAIICQLLRTARYVDRIGVPVLLDYQDCFSAGMYRRASLSPLLTRWFYRLEAALLSRYEAKCYSRFDATTIISKNDRDLFRFEGKQEIHIIPNGVDTKYFINGNTSKAYDILFTGNLSYPPNVDAARFLVKEVIPILTAQGINIHVLLAGANPAASVRSLASDRVTVSGWMDDIRDAYNSASIFTAPMRLGTGLQNKLLEAMSMSKPCITSPLANQGLEAEAGKEILVAQTAEEVASYIKLLLNDPELAASLALKGRAFVERQYSWEHSATLLNEILRRITMRG